MPKFYSGNQVMRPTLVAILAALSAVAVSACATQLGPITPGTLRVITGSDIPLSDREGMLGRRDDQTWMLITFASDDDYVEVAKRKQMNVFVSESLCDHKHVIRDIMTSSIHTGPLPEPLQGKGVTKRQFSQRFLYRTYVIMEDHKNIPPGADPALAERYDLHSENHDLCIQVKGGNMVGMTMASGIAVFPTASVKAAVEAVQPSQ